MKQRSDMENSSAQPKTKEAVSLRDKVYSALNTTKSDSETIDQTNVRVTEAKTGAPVRTIASDRTNTRVLFIEEDTSVLIAGSARQMYYANVSQFFDEVHIIVINTGRTQPVVERPMKHVFLYQVSGRHTWGKVWNARLCALAHLRFSNVSRPDIVVAQNPFLAGLAAWVISWSLKRPWQVHVSLNPYDATWVASNITHKSLRRLAGFVLARARSVRTKTDEIKTSIAKRHKKISDLQTLPKHHNIDAFKNSQAAFDVHKRYNQFSFVMLTQVELISDSPLHDVFSAVHQLLHNHKVGLIVLGSGKAKQLFAKKAALLGITTNVVFATHETDLASYYKTADVFIETDHTDVGDQHILQAVSAGVPIVAYASDFRNDILTSGESAYLCTAGDAYCLGESVKKLLNDQATRARFARATRTIATEQLHENVAAYYAAVARSIEVGVVGAAAAGD